MSKKANIESVYFLNVRFDCIDIDLIASNLHSMADNGPCYIVTPNVDHVVRINKNIDTLKEVYEQASLSLCDSRVLKLIALLKGVKLPEVITGSDLTKYLFHFYFKEKDNIAIIGGDSSIIDKLRCSFEHLSIYHYNPPMGFISSASKIDECIEFISKNSPAFIFLAVGSPQQEILANHILKKIPDFPCVVFCIGASILFLTGDEKRAPFLFQKLHIEWLFRIFQSPKKMAKRYALNAMGLALLLLGD